MKRLHVLNILIVEALLAASTIAAVIVPMDIQQSGLQPEDIANLDSPAKSDIYPGGDLAAVDYTPQIGPPIPGSPPSNVAASDGTFTDMVEVSWVGVPRANKYHIFRDTDPGGAAMVQIGTKSSHTYKDYAITDMQVYYYWVIACNKTGCSEISASDSGYAQLTEIPASGPANVAASDGSFTDKVVVSWDAVADAAEYQIFRDADQSGAAMTQIGTTAALSHNDTAVVDLQVYYYWVKACSISGCSSVSIPDSGYAVPDTPTSGPGGVAASDGTYTDHVAVSWDAVTDASEYQLWRDTGPTGTSMTQIDTTASLSYDDYGVTQLHDYHYWIKACNISGCSPVSTSDSGYAAPEAPTSGPGSVAASDGTYTDHIAVSWDAVTDAAEYQVWRDTTPTGTSMTQIDTTASLSYDDYGVTQPQVYHYWIKACNISGCSPVSTPDSGYAEAITGGIIFWDDIETGDFSQWTRYNSGGGWLYPCNKAGINGDWGACVERGSNNRRKQLIDETPIDQTNFQVRFIIDINSLSMGNGERFRFMQVKMGAERPFFIVVINRDGYYEIQLNTLLDDLTKVKSGWYPLADRPVTIEVDWEAASGDGANDGYTELYIDDLLQEALTGLDNDTIFVDTFKIGFTSRLEDKLISGVFCVDDVATSNGGYIGLP